MMNLTPENMRCAMTMSCPGVYELDDGRLLIVGLAFDEVDRDKWREMVSAGTIGANEDSVVIDRALLSEVLRDKPAP